MTSTRISAVPAPLDMSVEDTAAAYAERYGWDVPSIEHDVGVTRHVYRDGDSRETARHLLRSITIHTLERFTRCRPQRAVRACPPVRSTRRR